jgi:hypothetical protein
MERIFRGCCAMIWQAFGFDVICRSLEQQSSHNPILVSPIMLISRTMMQMSETTINFISIPAQYPILMPIARGILSTVCVALN